MVDSEEPVTGAEPNEPANPKQSSEKRSIGQWIKSHKLIVSVLCLTSLFLLAILLAYPFNDKIKAISYQVSLPGITDLRSKEAMPDPLTFEFSESAALLEVVGKTVTTGVQITPTIGGQWRWKGDRQLIFTPSEDWGVGKEYEVTLSKTLFPDHVRLNDYNYDFKTQGFAAKLRDVQLYQDPENPKIKTLVATVRFTHQVDQDDFRERVTLKIRATDKRIKAKETDYAFEISYDETGSEAFIHSQPVAIPEKEQEFILTISKGSRSLRDADTLDEDIKVQQTVPGMYSYFRITSARPQLIRNNQNEPEQVLIIEATDGIHEKTLQRSIEVWALPDYLPAIDGRKRVNRYHYSATRVDDRILNISRRLDLDFLPTDKEYATQHSMKFQAKPRGQLFIRIMKGISSAGGYVLADTYATTTTVPIFPREVEIMAKGAILSLKGNQQLSVVSRGNEALIFEVGRVNPDQLQHLISQTRGNFQNPRFRNYLFNAENITEKFSKNIRFPSAHPGKSQYTSFDFKPYLHNTATRKNGVFLVKVSGWDPVRKRVTSVSDKRLVLVTDLGLLVKDNSDKTHEAYVMSLSSGQPVANAMVSVIGKNGKAIFSGKTDASGHVNIPSMRNNQHEKTPTAFYVSKNGDLSFMPYNRHDRRLDVSRFDVGGIRKHGKKDAISAYLFSDRGIYRPGDRFNIGMIVKSESWSHSLRDIPLETVITDPRGLTIKQQKFSLSASGFEELSYQTLESSPTGEYHIKLYLIENKKRRIMLGSTTVKVEEFLPDRMKINVRFSKERSIGWVSPYQLQGMVTLKNLYGTPATQRRIAAQISLSPSHPVFAKHRDYRFFDPLRGNKSFSEFLADSTTDDKGETVLTLNLDRFKDASYKVKLRVNGFEAEGGRSVSAERSILVSPREYLVGYKADGNLGYIGKGSKRAVNFIAIDPKMEQLQAKQLTIHLIEQRYVSTLMKQRNGTYKYQSVLKETILTDEPFEISARGTNYSLPSGKSGDFVIVVRDAGDAELSRVKFSVAGEANLARNLEKNAELQINLDKKDYSAGENIKIHIRAPYTGAGLITIERDRVYAHKWFKTNSTSTVQNITLPKGIEGNAYINVSFVRSTTSKEIFMSPLSYGIKPFTINRDKRKNNVTLDVPYLLRPGDKVNIGYQAQRSGKIIIFAVNEGILQVANYKMPQPLAHFFKKRALEVNTSQILDMLLPEYSIVRNLANTGGGAMAAEALSKNLNPFKRKRDKPVVFWSGILDASSEKKHVEYQIPDYFNGTLRFMAVVVSEQAMGAASTKSLVRGHFVLSPNVPTFVAPGDEFSISVNVANNVEESGDNARVGLNLKTSKHLVLLDDQSRVLDITEGREKSAVFRLRASEKYLGSANFEFSASLGDKQSSVSVDLSVRPAMPYITDVSGGFVKKDDVNIKLERNMFPEFRTRQFSVSPVPLNLSRGLVRYLDKYPYLCTEQLVSRAVPVVALKGRNEFGYDAKRSHESIEKVVYILRSRQNSEGAFGFWASNSFVSPFQTVYALHFLRDARDKGFSIPSDMIERGNKYLRQLSNQDIDNLADAHARSYAIYLLTRDGIVTTRSLNDMRAAMDKYYKGKWDNDLSRVYMAASYKLLRLDSEARKLIRTVSMQKPIINDYEHFYDKLSHDAQYLYILARHFPEEMKTLRGEDIMKMVDVINNGRFNTLSSAATIRALAAYGDAVGQPKELAVVIKGVLADGQLRPILLPQGLMPEIDLDESVKSVNIDNQGQLPLFYQSTQAGFDRDMPDTVVKQGIEVQREYRNVDDKVVDEVQLGDEIKVHVKLRSIDNKRHYHVAIVDLLPGGFEVVLDQSRGNQGDWRPRYVDLREDRVLLFGTVDTSVKEYVYTIKATNRGQFKVPPVFSEGMYDRSIRATGIANVIYVK